MLESILRPSAGCLCVAYTVRRILPGPVARTHVRREPFSEKRTLFDIDKQICVIVYAVVLLNTDLMPELNEFDIIIHTFSMCMMRRYIMRKSRR